MDIFQCRNYWNMDLHEWAFVVITANYLFYLLFYKLTSHRSGNLRAELHRIYQNWVDARLKDGDHLVSIQSIRNLLMTDSVFISALLIALGVFPSILSESWQDVEVSLFGLIHVRLVELQGFVIISILIISLLNFILSIRYYNRLNILITAYPASEERANWESVMGRNLMHSAFNRGQRHFMWGNKSFYYLIAAFTWLISSYLVIIFTCVITIVLIVMDDIGKSQQTIHVGPVGK